MAQSGAVELRFTNLCYRCNLINVDQASAEVTHATFDTLASRRRTKEGVKSGNHAVIQKVKDTFSETEARLNCLSVFSTSEQQVLPSSKQCSTFRRAQRATLRTSLLCFTHAAHSPAP